MQYCVGLAILLCGDVPCFYTAVIWYKVLTRGDHDRQKLVSLSYSRTFCRDIWFGFTLITRA